MAEAGQALDEKLPLENPPILDVAQQLEEMFKHRYTDLDEKYMENLNTPLPDPPCVENWYSRPKRSFDYARGGRGRGRGGGYRGGDRRHGDGGQRYNDYHGRRDHQGGYDRHQSHQGHGYGAHRDRDSSGQSRVFYPNDRQGDRNRDGRHHPYNRDQPQRRSDHR